MGCFDTESLKRKALGFYERGRVSEAYLQDDETLFPLRLPLCKISQKEIRENFMQIRKEIAELERAGLPLEYRTFRFSSIGEQRLPVAVLFSSRREYLDALGLWDRFTSFVHESGVVLDAFGSLRTLLAEKPKLIEEYAGDWERIVAVCRYILEHPNPGIYLRQLPVEGVDTKFIATRKKVIDLLLVHLLPKETYREDITALGKGGFEKKYGFLTPRPMVRFRILDSAWYINGLEEMAVADESFANLNPRGIERVFIIENLATFLAFPRLPKSMTIFGSGYGAGHFKSAQWLRQKRLYYWGDLDSHGFAILSQFRNSFTDVESMLMDRATVERFSHLAVEEPSQKRFEGLPGALSKEERELFLELREKRFRLEQERIPLAYLQKYLQRKGLID